MGIGLKQQDVDLEFEIGLHTSSSVTVINVSINNGAGKSLLVSVSSWTAH